MRFDDRLCTVLNEPAVDRHDAAVRWRQLVDLVARAGPNASSPIVIEGQYGGYVSARRISRMPLRFNVNSLEGFGPHERASPGEPPHALAAAVLTTPSPDFVE